MTIQLALCYTMCSWLSQQERNLPMRAYSEMTREELDAAYADARRDYRKAKAVSDATAEIDALRQVTLIEREWGKRSLLENF